ncbi:outer membrane protein [Legionella fairfieldensis]|uniref:outer membrane protein n=1 Tax=Legionella fairfieldensis TaxID=45064 RepID=UPI0004912EB4|nr:outer membrane beta-barrel protein [Legionella fairfieldensis]
MLRTTSLMLSLFLLATPCFSGFYVGVSGGPEGASFSQKAHVTRATIFATGNFNVVDKQHFSGTGGFGSLFAGYSLYYNRLYLAGEINGNFSTVEYRLVNDEYTHLHFSKTSFTVKSSEGAGLLPGYFLADSTLIYGRIGYANGRINIDDSDPTIHSMRKNRSGIRYGGGIRYDLTPQFTFMMDYSQINYGSLKSHVYEPVGMVYKSTKITPNTAQVAFGLMYNFDVPARIVDK